MHTDGNDSDAMEGVEEEFYVVSRGDFSGSPPLEATGGEPWTNISPPPLPPPVDPTLSRDAVAESSTSPTAAAPATAPAPPARPTPARKMSVTELVSKLDYETPKSLDKRLPVFSDEERAQRANLTRQGHEMRREQEEESERFKLYGDGARALRSGNSSRRGDSTVADHLQREQEADERRRWQNASKIPCDCGGPHPHPPAGAAGGVHHGIILERVRPARPAGEEAGRMPGSFTFGGQAAVERNTRDDEEDSHARSTTFPYHPGELSSDRVRFYGKDESLQRWLEKHPEYTVASDQSGEPADAVRVLPEDHTAKSFFKRGGTEESSCSEGTDEEEVQEQKDRLRATHFFGTRDGEATSNEEEHGALSRPGQESAPAMEGASDPTPPSDSAEKLGGPSTDPPFRRWLEAEAEEVMRRHMDLSRRAQAQIAEIQRQRLEEQAASGQPVLAASRSSKFSYDAEGNVTSFREGPSRRFRLGQRGIDGSYHIDEELPPERRSAFQPAPRRHPAESPE